LLASGIGGSELMLYFRMSNSNGFLRSKIAVVTMVASLSAKSSFCETLSNNLSDKRT
jgi:hypothetical protein